MVNVFELMMEYIQSGRVTIDKSKHPQLTTVHDPCNYTRKSQMAIGKSYGPEIRWITQQLVDNYVDMYPLGYEQLLLRGRRRGLGHAL